MNSTDVVELELKSKRFSLSMKKKEALAPPELPQVPLVFFVASCIYAKMQHGRQCI